MPFFLFGLAGGGGTRRKKKRGMLGIFDDVQISRIWEKVRHEQGRRPSVNYAYRGRGRGCKVIVATTHVCTHMEYLFPTGNENIFSSQHCTRILFYLLNLYFPLQ